VSDRTVIIVQLQLPSRRSSWDILYAVARSQFLPTQSRIGYHSHLSTQYCDGLRGPIVVYDPQDPYKADYDVDDETTIISLTDHYHDTAPKLQKNWFGLGGIAPIGNTILVNGVGNCDAGTTGKTCTSANSTKWSTINVKEKSRYRLRFINMACDAAFRVSIQSHAMDIIESDSTYTQKLNVDYFDIWPGQRFSAIVNANQTAGNYCGFFLANVSGVANSEQGCLLST
jgi:iron transport multicopper oxidase